MQDPLALKLDTDPTALMRRALPVAGDKTEAAARQFEGMVMSLLFQAMRKTVEPSGLLGDGGQARSTYEMLLDQALVDKAVGGGRSWGLADRLSETWKRASDARKDAHPLTDPGKLPIGTPSR